MQHTLDQQLESILRTYLPAVAGDAPLPMDKPLSELGLDSLNAVNLVLELEDTFGIEFPDSILSEATFETGAALREAMRTLLLASNHAEAR